MCLPTKADPTFIIGSIENGNIWLALDSANDRFDWIHWGELKTSQESFQIPSSIKGDYSTAKMTLYYHAYDFIMPTYLLATCYKVKDMEWKAIQDLLLGCILASQSTKMRHRNEAVNSRKHDTD